MTRKVNGRRGLAALIAAGMLITGMTACASGGESAPEAKSESAAVESAAESAAASTAVNAESTPAEASAEEVVLAAGEAAVTGEGISLQGETAPTAYSEDVQAIVNLGTGSKISFTVPGEVDGEYDIYLDISRAFYPFGTTYLTAAVNDNPATTMPVYLKRTEKEDYSDLFEMETYLMKEAASLKEGDVITFTGLPGYEVQTETGMQSLMPAAFGGVTLKKAVPAEEQAVNSEDVLAGKTIGWLGSSVTYGMMSGGYSMTNAIEDGHEGTKCYNYSISGTTLANQQDSSYVERLKLIDPEKHFDLFIVQLSTNDAAKEMPLGEITEEKDRNALDDTTVAGAMEWIVSYVKETWNCPVMFYTGVYYENETYGKMVELVKQIEDKWEIGVIDLWNNEEMKALYGTDAIKEYMADDTHPTYKGYTEWWTPAFEASMSEYLKEQ